MFTRNYMRVTYQNVIITIIRIWKIYKAVVSEI